MNGIALLLPFAVGLLAGLFHFGGLWYTLRHLPGARHPALWMASSFLLRAALVTAAFIPIVQWGWRAAAVALVGLTLPRLALSRRIIAAERR